MDYGVIASFVALGFTILGVAVQFGKHQQQMGDMEKNIILLSKDQEEWKKTATVDGNRLTRLETQYAQIISMLSDLKSDLRGLTHQHTEGK